MKIESLPCGMYESYNGAGRADRQSFFISWDGLNNECRICTVFRSGGSFSMYLTREDTEGLRDMLTEALESQEQEA